MTDETEIEIIGDEMFAVLSDGTRILVNVRCEDCGQNWPDYPSKLCPGCIAYQGHCR